jgi:hypothetical protein
MTMGDGEMALLTSKITFDAEDASVFHYTVAVDFADSLFDVLLHDKKDKTMKSLKKIESSYPDVLTYEL